MTQEPFTYYIVDPKFPSRHQHIADIKFPSGHDMVSIVDGVRCIYNLGAAQAPKKTLSRIT